MVVYLIVIFLQGASPEVIALQNHRSFNMKKRSVQSLPHNHGMCKISQMRKGKVYCLTWQIS